mgnify:CR=1 FL=1
MTKYWLGNVITAALMSLWLSPTSPIPIAPVIVWNCLLVSGKKYLIPMLAAMVAPVLATVAPL